MCATQAGTEEAATIWDKAFAYAAGDPAALALTSATLVFFWSGRLYSKAWHNRQTPDRRLARLGDLSSGAGAILLGIGLLLIGNPILAAFAGALHATGKLGSAFAGERTVRVCGRKLGVADLGKQAVLASRVPAILAAIGGWVAADAPNLLVSLNVVACTLIWASADWMLLPRTSLIKSATGRLLGV